MTSRPAVSVEHISFRESGQFAARDVAFAELDAGLLAFGAHPPTLESFGKTIELRKSASVDRQALVEVVREQYKSYGVKPPAKVARLLEGSTFTVTTAHQASIFLGPLYYVYKIISTVALARKLSSTYPDSHIVPVFVLGAEDHDLEEIDHVFVRGQRAQWHTDQTGATGAMQLTGIEDAIRQVSSILGESYSSQRIVEMLKRIYRPERTLGEATAAFVAELFFPYDLVVVNLNHPRFKAAFAPIIEREVMQQESRDLVQATQDQLAARGFSAQAHAREINFFYLQKGRRDRIERSPEGFHIVGTEQNFSESEMQQLIADHPDRFSPNVVMRPLLQELCLPNLAYVGGGGELAYWLERKSQFEHFGLPYPVLVRRDSSWWIDAAEARKLSKLGLQAKDLLGDEHALLRRFVTSKSETDLDFSPFQRQISEALEEISRRTSEVDATLRQRPLALNAQVEKALKALETRLVRRLKKQQVRDVEIIHSLRQKLLPGGGLQERRESFLDLYLRYGKHFFELLLENFDPLDMRLKVIEELPTTQKKSFETRSQSETLQDLPLPHAAG